MLWYVLFDSSLELSERLGKPAHGSRGCRHEMAYASRKRFLRHFAPNFGQVFINTFPKYGAKWHQKAKADDVCHLVMTPPKDDIVFFLYSVVYCYRLTGCGKGTRERAKIFASRHAGQRTTNKPLPCTCFAPRRAGRRTTNKPPPLTENFQL